MESNWAVENIQVIRTLMERSALYRRALAPIMTLNGALGLLGAFAGWALNLNSPRSFILFWTGICLVAVACSLFMVRRQALTASEPFWSPPTRRVMEAFSPAVDVGFIVTLIVFLNAGPGDRVKSLADMQWLPIVWVVLYGCVLNAAGFFIPRGVRRFSRIFIFGGALLTVTIGMQTQPYKWAYLIMGCFFGVMHLAYGVYLYFTERRANAA